MGRPLAAPAIRKRILLATEGLFGTPINPRAFRTCAATSFALRSPTLARRLASPLRHRYFSITGKHHVKAGHLEASRCVNTALRKLRGRPRNAAGVEVAERAPALGAGQSADAPCASSPLL